MLKYRIIDIKVEPDQVKILKMEPAEEGMQIMHEPGQFIMMHLLDEKGRSLDKRPYSITSAPGERILEFCIKMIGGKFTSKIDKLKKGGMVGIEGPMGHFIYEGDKCVFICGGTGIAPVMSMVRDIAKKEKRGSYFLFYSARKKDSLVYFDELNGLAKKNPGLKVVYTLTREEPEGWAWKCGRIKEELLREYVVKPSEFKWYVCGPLEMTRTLKECIIGMGAKEDKVHFEGWG